MRDHGGNIDAAIELFGGTGWIDLSTGINRVPYQVPALPDAAWTLLPTRSAIAQLCAVAARSYRTNAAILPLAGAQQAIQLIPRLGAPGLARVLAPTYNEHAGALEAAGWRVEQVASLGDLAGADLAVVVNPNNPDGRRHPPQRLLQLAGQVGRLVVDESFADADPALTIAPDAGRRGLFVLRSFGKFYGLAGVRLGFVIGHDSDLAQLSEMAGPWPVSGAAIEIGRVALADSAWAHETLLRLQGEVLRMDGMAQGAGWKLAGGTPLFRLYETPDAAAAQEKLAGAQIWSRIFPYSRQWLRLGLPGPTAEWLRLAGAMER